MAAAAGPSQFNPPSGMMPAYSGFEITPSASNLAQPARALYVGTGGTVVLLTMASVSLTFVNVQSGAMLPVQCIKVHTTGSGTTAGNIIGII